MQSITTILSTLALVSSITFAHPMNNGGQQPAHPHLNPQEAIDAANLGPNNPIWNVVMAKKAASLLASNHASGHGEQPAAGHAGTSTGTGTAGSSTQHTGGAGLHSG